MQKKNQDIVNALRLIKISKNSISNIVNSGFEALLNDVIVFCNLHEIDIPDLQQPRKGRGCPENDASLANLENLKEKLFNPVLEMCLDELNTRFDAESCNI